MTQITTIYLPVLKFYVMLLKRMCFEGKNLYCCELDMQQEMRFHSFV